MAKAIKYRAEHQGTNFSRKSQRTYTHAVLQQCSRSVDRKELERHVRNDWECNHGFYEKLLTEHDWAGYTAREIEAKQEFARRWLDGGEEGRVARALARHDELNAGKPDVYWVCLGWCGRLDLAQKLAAGDPRNVILEAKAEG